MNATDEDLRVALRLLEQRAPDAPREAGRDHTPSRWASAWRLASVAAVVLVVAGVATFLSLRTDSSPPAPLAGPTAGVSTHATAKHPPPMPGPRPIVPAVLRVRVSLFGGPAKPNRHAALKNSPSRGASVRVTRLTDSGDARGRVLHMTTDRHGVATFTLKPGRVDVTSKVCGSGFKLHDPVTLRAGRNGIVQIKCAVP